MSAGLKVPNSGWESIQNVVEMGAAHESLLPSALNGSGLGHTGLMLAGCSMRCTKYIHFVPYLTAEYAGSLSPHAGMFEQSVWSLCGTSYRTRVYYSPDEYPGSYTYGYPDGKYMGYSYEEDGVTYWVGTSFPLDRTYQSVYGASFVYESRPGPWLLPANCVQGTTTPIRVEWNYILGEDSTLYCAETAGPEADVQGETAHAIQSLFSYRWPGELPYRVNLTFAELIPNLGNDLYGHIMYWADGPPNKYGGDPLASIATNHWNGSVLFSTGDVQSGWRLINNKSALTTGAKAEWIRGRVKLESSTPDKAPYFIGRLRVYDAASKLGYPLETPSQELITAKIPEYSYEFVRAGWIYEGKYIGDEAVIETGNIDLPFPDTTPYPLQPYDIDNHPVAQIGDFYFAVIGRDPSEWARSMSVMWNHVRWIRYYGDRWGAWGSEHGWDPIPGRSAISSASNDVKSGSSIPTSS
jgi:hypothetical protein